MRWNGEQTEESGVVVGESRWRQDGQLVVIRRAPANPLGHTQPILPRAFTLKIRSDRKGRLQGTALGRSSLSSATSKVTFLCSRQDRVSVVAKSPFSKNLLPGG